MLQPDAVLLYVFPFLLGIISKMRGRGSGLVVLSAIVGNSMVMITKFIAAAITGSGSMLSEGIHSSADVFNQVLLWIGIWASRRPPDEEHPYGHESDRFVFAIISAVGIFFLGSGVTAYHGIYTFYHPTPLIHVGLAFLVLVLSFIFEGTVLLIAVRELRHTAKGRPMFEFLKKRADPTAVAVLLEDSVAILGIIIAFFAIGLTQVTKNILWDAIGSMIIAGLLAITAIILIAQNRRMLIGVAMPAHDRAKLLQMLKKNPAIEKVYDFKSRQLSVDKYRVKMEIEFEGRAIAKKLEPHIAKSYPKIKTYEQFRKFCEDFADLVTESLGDEVDRIEEEIQRTVPEVKHVDIETD